MISKALNKLIKRYQGMSLPVKAGLWFTICNFLQRGISVLTVPIFTRLLTKEQYGVYNLYLSWLNLLSVFTSLNLYYGVFNKAMVKYEDDRERYISSMQGLITVLCGAFFISYLLFNKNLNTFFELSTPIMCMMFLEMLMVPALQFWMGKKRFEYDYKPIVIVSILKSVLNPLLGIVFVILSERKAEARIYAIVAVEVVVGGFLFIIQFLRGKSFFDKEYWMYSLKFNIPLIPHYLSGSILNQGDRIVIQKVTGETYVAMYGVAYNVAMLTQLITNAISQAITPWLYRRLREKNYDGISQKLRPIMILVAGVSCVLMLLAPEIVWIFAPKEYSSSVYVIPPIAASVYFIYMYNVFSNFEFYFEKKIFIAIASMIAAIMNVVLNIVFVPLFGYVAAGYTTLFCYAVYAFSHFCFSKIICMKEIGSAKIFELHDFWVCALIVVAFSFVSGLLYSNIVVRYAVIMLIILAGFLLRKRIIHAIKEIGIRKDR